MKKELSPPQTIAIIAVFVVVVAALGYFWMNRSPVASAGTVNATGQATPMMPNQKPPANAPTGNGGSQGNQPLTPDT